MKEKRGENSLEQVLHHKLERRTDLLGESSFSLGFFERDPPFLQQFI